MEDYTFLQSESPDNFHSTFYKEVPINTNIYENYDWKVKNGVLYVTLFEKINEKPPIFKHDLPEKGVNGSEN